ncbi:hypothetical protein NL676_029729 [Syzygium grande]|nr:hypothetical protein NL676_029729 [Syzygium grande]
MVQYMQNPVINSTPVAELTVEERNLLSTSDAPGFGSIQLRTPSSSSPKRSPCLTQLVYRRTEFAISTIHANVLL